MEEDYHEEDYWKLLDELNHCEKESDKEFEIYQRLAELGEKEIGKLEEDLSTDVIHPDTGELLGWNPAFLDDFAAPMDNLSRLYIERKEYAKALPLLEKASLCLKGDGGVSAGARQKVSGYSLWV